MVNFWRNKIANGEDQEEDTVAIDIGVRVGHFKLLWPRPYLSQYYDPVCYNPEIIGTLINRVKPLDSV